MMSCSGYVIYKVNEGSKSVFAFVLMLFTFFEGTCYFSFFIMSLFRHTDYADGETHHVYNMYAN